MIKARSHAQLPNALPGYQLQSNAPLLLNSYLCSTLKRMLYSSMASCGASSADCSTADEPNTCLIS